MPLCSFGLCVKAHVVGWWRHYIHFSKVALFLLGLAVAHGLVKNSVLDVLISYLTDEWGNPSLKIAAAIINAEEAISGVIAFIIAILTQVWVGWFKMVVSTTASFILGLLLLWVSTLRPVGIKHPIFYVALVLIAVGKGGKVPPFKDFIRDQISGKDEKQVEDRTTIWWRACRFTGAFISVLILSLSSVEWREIFLICAVVMGATYLVFLAGDRYHPYNKASPTGKHPFIILLKVVKAAFSKRSLCYPPSPSGYFLNQRNELPLFPRDPFLRCIDRAAIVEHASEVEAEQEENLCTVEEVRQAKSLLRLFPLCLVFIFYGIVSAAGSTFFIEQSSGLDETIPINSFFIMASAVSYISSYLSDWLISKYWSGNEMWKLNGVLVKVGAGIVVSIICCEVASLVEHARLSRVNKHVDLHMSILWLAPQFILLGLMEGLSEDGLSELFDIFVHESTEGLDDSFTQMILGFGKVLSVGCVFVFRGWFGKSINTSHLDEYYNMLMYLSIGNLAFYVLIGFYYVYIQKQETQFGSTRGPLVEAAENKEPEFVQAPEQVRNENEDVIFSQEAELELDEMPAKP